MSHYLTLFTGIRFCDINLPELKAPSGLVGQLRRYYPKHAVAVAVCCDQYGGYEYIVAKSTPHCGHDEGYHAEEILIRYLVSRGELEDVEAIYITYSPCSSCTTLLLDVFQYYRKPNIKFLCIYGEPGTRKHEGAIRSLKLLIQNGFAIDAWYVSAKRLSTYYVIKAEEFKTRKELARVEESLIRCKMLFLKSARNTRSMIEEIKMQLRYNEPYELSLSVDFPYKQLKFFTRETY